MKSLSEKVLKLSASKTVLLDNRAKQMVKEGRDIINFCPGELNFSTPQWILDGAFDYLKNGDTKYSHPAGLPELREAITKQYFLNDGLEFHPDQVIVTNGAKQAIYNSLICLLNPGDEVLIPSPYWVTFPEAVKLVGGTPIYLPTKFESHYKITPLQLENAITNNTKLIILNSPSNPAGVLYSQAELKALAKIICDSDIYCLTDEIYRSIIYDSKKFTSISNVYEDMKSRTIIINGFSKSHAMTGWRIGYCLAPKDISPPIIKTQGQTTHHPSNISQYAALCALKDSQQDKTFNSEIVDQLTANRELVNEILSSTNSLRFHKPEGAFYYWIDITKCQEKGPKSLENSFCEWFCQQLLEKYELALVPGIAFGTKNHVRLSFACDKETLDKGMARLTRAVNDLLS